MSDKYFINDDGRCVALKDFGDVKRGDTRGFVESLKNLSQSGKSWVYDNGRVSGNATIPDDAEVYDTACLSGESWLIRNSEIRGNTIYSIK